ncbi:MAG TPA: hypothetical protein VN372_08770 [Methanospirillum sp.]|nr:hypothetical protein [Methanospirillum sp.]
MSDQIGAVLSILTLQEEAITMRHIVHETGIASTTLVGIMMSMINQGYIREVTRENVCTGNPQNFRCGCACCSRKDDSKTTSSLDRRLFQITLQGRNHLGARRSGCCSSSPMKKRNDE